MGTEDKTKTDFPVCDKCGKIHNPEDGCGKKKKDGIQHYDMVDAPEFMTKKFERTQEGYLTGRAVVTNIGVFSYMNADGTVTRELRLPEEVFNPASISSLKMKPLTNDHPMEAVTTENIKKYQVGMTGNNPSYPATWEDGEPRNPEYMGKQEIGDAYHIAVDMTITDKQTIEDILNGKMELSCGYTAEVEEASGVWMGVPYDAIQRNIRYNHVAIVDRARAGDAARLKLDSAGAVSFGHNISIKEDAEDMKKIHIDGVEYQAEAAVIAELTKEKTAHADASKEFESLKKDKEDVDKKLSTIEGERDGLKEKLDELEKSKKELFTKEQFDKAIEEKLIIKDSAKKAEVEIKEDMSDEDIKKEIIMKVFPKAKLDGKDEAYLSARFDMAIEELETEAENTQQNRDTVLDSDTGDTDKERVDSAKAHQAYLDRLQSAYKKEDK